MPSLAPETGFLAFSNRLPYLAPESGPPFRMGFLALLLFFPSLRRHPCEEECVCHAFLSLTQPTPSLSDYLSSDLAHPCHASPFPSQSQPDTPSPNPVLHPLQPVFHAILLAALFVSHAQDFLRLFSSLMPEVSCTCARSCHAIRSFGILPTHPLCFSELAERNEDVRASMLLASCCRRMRTSAGVSLGQPSRLLFARNLMLAALFALIYFPRGRHHISHRHPHILVVLTCACRGVVELRRKCSAKHLAGRRRRSWQELPQ